MFESILKVIPGWVFALIGCLVLAGTIWWVVDTISDQSTEIGQLQGEKNQLVATNATQKAEIDRLKQDAEDKAKTSENITKETQASNQEFGTLENKLKAATLERQALEAALAAKQSLGIKDEPQTPTDGKPSTSKPVVTQAQIDKASPEIDIAWEAYCVGSTDPKCVKGK